MLAMLAFAIDIGYMCVVKAESQNAADSAAMAAAWELLAGRREPSKAANLIIDTTRTAEAYAGYHRVSTNYASLVSDEDVIVGMITNPADPHSEIVPATPLSCNAVQVNVRLLNSRGTQSSFFFGPIFGSRDFETSASATAAFLDNVSGFNVTEEKSKSSLLPFTLLNQDWHDLLNNNGTYSDNYTYDEKTRELKPGADGIKELKLYPVNSGAGNWGTIDIGSNDNSTSDLVRQILEGINHEDLSYFDGRLELDPITKNVMLDGETGISAGIRDALGDIIGAPRTIPLYREAIGTGDTLTYEVIGFAGIRILDIKLTGNDKHILVQPAIVVDDTAVTSEGENNSHFILQPVRLIR